MKLLVFSDSHASVSFMRYCIEKIKPNGIIHLGDHYDDGQVLLEENPQLPFQQVPGNCDRYRCPFGVPEVLCCSFWGVRFYLTHGHNHRVKTGIGALLADARRSNVSAVLYGHTHVADCHCEPDGLWVLNPGTCGSWGGSVGLITISDNTITDCRILRQSDLEEHL